MKIVRITGIEYVIKSPREKTTAHDPESALSESPRRRPSWLCLDQ